MVYQQEGERNFHSFYNLVYGASESELREYGLKSSMIAQYNYLNQSSVSLTPNHDDKSNYRLVNDAMRIANFDPALIKTIWSLVAAVVHLGNLKFESRDDEVKDHNNNNSNKIINGNLTTNGVSNNESRSNNNSTSGGAQVAQESMETIKTISKLIKIDEAELIKALTTRLIASGSKEVVTTFHSAKEAAYARDALAKVS